MNVHYDEAVLQEYLDDPESFPRRSELETHLLICAACRAVLEELRAFEAALSSEAVWSAVNADDPPESVRALADLLESEDADAEAALAPYVSSPAAFRRAHIAAMPEMRTAGIVRVAIRPHGSSSEVAFTDTGPGIPENVRARIFTPFFTTKSRGSGLGLPTAKRLVEAHQGQLTIDCPLAGGTTVVIRLPTGAV